MLKDKKTITFTFKISEEQYRKIETFVGMGLNKSKIGQHGLSIMLVALQEVLQEYPATQKFMEKVRNPPTLSLLNFHKSTLPPHQQAVWKLLIDNN